MSATEPGRTTARVPSLEEYLDADVRGEGFEQWIAAQLAMPSDGLADDHALWLRLAKTFGVACVEQMNREAERDPSPEAIGKALAMWSRVAGFITITAVASVSKDDANFRRLARILSEEFKIGAKLAADTLEEREPVRA